jgi:transcriptional regulator with XRE-family HTH domain
MSNQPTTPDRGYLATQLGNALTLHRSNASLSQRAQAKALGIAGNTLRELELGLANPTLARIEELAEALGLKVELKVTRKGGKR